MSVLKLSLPGVDVETGKPNECVIDAEYANPKIKKNQDPLHRGLIQLSLNNTYPPGDTIVYTLPHNYGYTPMVWAVISNNSNSNIFGFQPYIASAQSVDVKTDNKNMYVVAHASLIPWTPSITLFISYSIFADNGARNQ